MPSQQPTPASAPVPCSQLSHIIYNGLDLVRNSIYTEQLIDALHQMHMKQTMMEYEQCREMEGLCVEQIMRGRGVEAAVRQAGLQGDIEGVRRDLEDLEARLREAKVAEGTACLGDRTNRMNLRSRSKNAKDNLSGISTTPSGGKSGISSQLARSQPSESLADLETRRLLLNRRNLITEQITHTRASLYQQQQLLCEQISLLRKQLLLLDEPVPRPAPCTTPTLKPSTPSSPFPLRTPHPQRSPYRPGLTKTSRGSLFSRAKMTPHYRSENKIISQLPTEPLFVGEGEGQWEPARNSKQIRSEYYDENVRVEKKQGKISTRFRLAKNNRHY